MELSERAERLKGQVMFQIKSKAEELERQRKRLIHFEIGDSQFNIPSTVKKALIKAIKQNKTHYVDSKGLYKLRKSIADLRGVDVENVLIAPANFQIFLSLSLLCNKGDEVVIPNPGFPTYGAVCNYLGLKVSKKITNKTKAVIVNFPNNPTGQINWERNCNLFLKCFSKGIWFINDAVYREMYYGEGYSLWIGLEKAIEINGFSKSHSMSGLRLGYMIAPKEIIDKASLLIETTVSCFPHFIQEAGLEAIKIQNYKMKELKKCMKLMVKGINSIRGLSCVEPKGAIYCWVKVGKRFKLGEDFADWALKRGVVVCPGSAFGKKNYVRFCFATSIKNIKEGIRRLKRN